MNTYSIYFDYQDGNGYELVPDYDVIKKSFKAEYILHKNLKPTTNRLSFELRTDSSTINKLIANQKNTLVYVEQNGFAFFMGEVRNTYQLTLSLKQKTKIQIEIVDNNFKLKNKITEEILYFDESVSYILEQLLLKAGFTSEYFPNTTIDENVAVLNVSRKDKKTYEEIITKLLFEYGYVYYFSSNGSMQLSPIVLEDTTTTQVFNDSNIYTTNTLSKKDSKKDSVEITYPIIEYKDDIPVFNDTTNGNDYWDMFFSIPAGGYYPQGATEDKPVYSQYDIEDVEILSVNNVSVEWDAESGIDLVKSNFREKDAEILFKNNSSSAKSLRKFKMRGNAVLKNGDNIIETDDGENDKTFSHKCDYLTERVDAENLSRYLFSYYQNTNFSYMITSFSDYDIGTLAKIQNSKLGLDVIGRIISKSFVEEKPNKYDYIIEQITPYQVGTATTQQVVHKPNRNLPENLAEKKDIIEGFEDELTGATATPEVLDGFAVELNYPSVEVSFPPQEKLTNLLRYEVQVSDDEIYWYSPSFSETNWKGELDQYTIFYTPYFRFHNLLKSYFTMGEETSQVYCRFRQRTKKDEVSEWSIPEEMIISNYYNWNPEKVILEASSGGRNVYLKWDTPAVDGKKVYDIQVSKDGSDWYKPFTGTISSEDDWKTGSLDEYLTIDLNNTSFLLPLEGEDTDEPTATYYYYRVRTRQVEASQNIGDWSDNAYLEVKPTGANDIVNNAINNEKIVDETITANKMNVEDLAAITGTFGSIQDGGNTLTGDAHNYWYLEDNPNGHKRGSFRIGDANSFLRYMPADNVGNEGNDGIVELDGADLTLSTSDLITYQNDVAFRHGQNNLVWFDKDTPTNEYFNIVGDTTNLKLFSGSDEVLRIDSDNKTQFFNDVDIDGKLTISNDDYLGQLELVRSGNAGLTLTNTSSSKSVNIYQEDGGFVVHNSSKFLIKEGGDVIVETGRLGIGTTSPDAKLDVNGNIKVKSNQYVSNSTYGLDMNNSDIVGCNDIYFNDAGEGLKYEDCKLIPYDNNKWRMYGDLNLMGVVDSRNGRATFYNRDKWTGEVLNGFGKIEYHADRFYMQSSGSTYITMFRSAGGTNVANIRQNGDFHTNGVVRPDGISIDGNPNFNEQLKLRRDSSTGGGITWGLAPSSVHTSHSSKDALRLVANDNYCVSFSYDGDIYTDGKVYGAVGNDYADAIEIDNEVEAEYGYCYVRDENNITSKSSKRCQKGVIGISTNTQTFTAHSFEEGDKYRIPISVSGFVLAYTDKQYKSGTPLTTGKDGYLTKMKRWELILFPERLVATYYKDMNIEEWNNVEVNNRNLVKVV